MKKIATQLILVLASIFPTFVFAQADKIEGVWFNDKKDAKIQVYQAKDGKYYGKIIWLKEPLKNGKAKLDERNQQEKLRNQPIVGLVILKGFKKEADSYSDGTIYDPENGKTYDCKMTYKGNSLSIRGYIGISLIGRTTVWERAAG